MNLVPHVAVTVSIQRDRRDETEKELIHIATGGNGPARQGTWSDLVWDFLRREDANLFFINARNIPGVLSVHIS